MNIDFEAYISKKLFSCDPCGKSFKWKKGLNAHYASVHAGEKPPSDRKHLPLSNEEAHRRTSIGVKANESDKCGICGKTFLRSAGLKSHLLIHTGEKRFSCDICGKTFLRSTDRKLHRRIHTGEKPFSCDICGKKFPRSWVLKEHLRIHTVEKPFSCDVCGNKFLRFSDLKTHLRTHTGEKPHSCENCNKNFSSSATLKRHVQRIHEKNFLPKKIN